VNKAGKVVRDANGLPKFTINPEERLLKMNQSWWDQFVRLVEGDSNQQVEDAFAQYEISELIPEDKLPDEILELPLDIAATLRCRSSYARRGVVLGGGFVDPGYRGQLTLCLSNLGNEDLRSIAKIG
jgi:hypothetical protein